MPSSSHGTVFEPRSGLLRSEQAAWKCIEQCCKKLNIEGPPIPIPIDVWIETALNIRFGVTDLSYLGEDVLGAAFVRDREILVSDRVLDHIGRFRFTCAHELGHVLLHKKHAAVFHETQELPHPDATRLERQADRFAAAILMPLRLMEQAVFSICREEELDAEYCLTEMMMPTVKSEWLWRAMFLPKITQRFAVSKTAAVIRCGDMQLASHATRSFLPLRFRDRLLERPTDIDLQFVRIIDGRPVVGRRTDSRTGRVRRSVFLSRVYACVLTRNR